MSDIKHEAPERIWAYAGSFKMWRDHQTDQPHTQTEYVRVDRIEELEAKLAAKEKLMLTLAGDKIDLVSELVGVKGKLAGAVKLAEEALDFNDDGDDCLGWHSINDRIEELKGQGDE